MAIGTPVQIGTGVHSDAGPYEITTSGAAASGDTVLLICTWVNSTSGATYSVTTAGGLTWQQDASLHEAPGADYGFTVFSAPAPSGLASSTLLVVTGTGGGTRFGMGLTAIAVSGIDTATTEDNAYDFFAGNNTNWWNADTPQNVTIAGEALVLVGVLADGITTGSSVTDAPATELSDFVDAGNDWVHSTAYRIETTPGDYSINGNYNASHSVGGAAGVIAYPTAGAVAAVPNLRIITAPRF